jgi:hypothetical protein
LWEFTQTCQENFLASTNHRLQFKKRSQLFIGVHNETLSVVAMRNSLRLSPPTQARNVGVAQKLDWNVKCELPTVKLMHVYEVRPRKDKRGVDLISDVLPSGCLWHAAPDAISNAIDYAKFRSRSHDAVIRVYDAAGKLIEVHRHKGDFVEPWLIAARPSTPLAVSPPQRLWPPYRELLDV